MKQKFSEFFAELPEEDKRLFQSVGKIAAEAADMLLERLCGEVDGVEVFEPGFETQPMLNKVVMALRKGAEDRKRIERLENVLGPNANISWNTQVLLEKVEKLGSWSAAIDSLELITKQESQS